MRNLVVAMIAVATAFIVVLSFGFWIHQRTDAIPDTLFGVISGLAIAAIAGVIACAMLGISPWSWVPRPGWKHSVPVERVHRRSPAEIAYAENKDMTASCVHLQPIERAMRMAGVVVRMREISPYLPVVMAECRINEAELKRVFALPASIYYKEAYQPERSAYDNPRGDIFCTECFEADRSRSDIQVLHPEESREDTPWFPTAP